jgi:DNA polymerase-3 subunit delta
VTPDQAIAEATRNELRPIYLIAGDEGLLISQVVSALRAASLVGAVPGLNEDQVNAAERGVDDALSAARTLPMLAKRRLVVVQRLERWEPKNETEVPVTSSKAPRKDPFERLLEYAKDPSPTTTLLLVGSGLDKRRKLYTTARNEGWLVTCDPLGRAELPAFISKKAEQLGAKLAPGMADLICELSGPELGAVVDAVTRLGLYAAGQTITEEMVDECVVRLRTASVWELVNAVARRDVGAALAVLDDVFEPSEGVRLVGLLAWSTRQLLRFDAAVRKGASPAEAAQQAGAPPFKARELAAQLKYLPPEVLTDWLLKLGEMDRALKGASKLPAKAILEWGIVELAKSRASGGGSLAARHRSA